MEKLKVAGMVLVAVLSVFWSLAVLVPTFYIMVCASGLFCTDNAISDVAFHFYMDYIAPPFVLTFLPAVIYFFYFGPGAPRSR